MNKDPSILLEMDKVEDIRAYKQWKANQPFDGTDSQGNSLPPEEVKKAIQLYQNQGKETRYYLPSDFGNLWEQAA